MHGAGGDVLWGYANLAAHLPSDQPVYGIKSRGQARRDEFETIEAMAGCYINEIRGLQPHGPYYLGGYCFGGNVAYEMARQFTAQGEEIALLLLLDAAPANAASADAGPKVPNFRGKTMRAVVEEASAIGLPVLFDGSGIARGQVPAPGTVLHAGERVRVQFAR